MASVPQSVAAFVEPLAAWRVTLDGRDLTDTLAPRLVALSISEARGEAADKLEIQLHDADGALALPPEGAKLAVSLGWKRGTGVPAGLVGKGTFVVDDVEWSGPPDMVTIRAHSADLGDSFRTRKSRVWSNTTVGTIVGQLAAEQGLTPRCHPDLAGKAVASIEQANRSDMQLLRDLGRRYDATATVKDGGLIFAPMDADTTATGKTLPTIILTRQSGDRVTYARSKREGGEDGAEAQWHGKRCLRAALPRHGVMG